MRAPACKYDRVSDGITGLFFLHRREYRLGFKASSSQENSCEPLDTPCGGPPLRQLSARPLALSVTLLKKNIAVRERIRYPK